MKASRTRSRRRAEAAGAANRQPFNAAPKPWLALIAVLAVLAFVAIVRWRLADVPLERDEGEYGYAGQLILQGVPPYKLAYNMKFPGTYYAYSVILAVFGQTAWGIHIGLLIVNAASVLVLFYLGKRWLHDSHAAAAAIAFAILSLDWRVMGIFAHATHFVMLPVLAGLLVLLRAIASTRLSGFGVAGALLGLAILMKQHAVLFLPFAFGLALWSERRQPAHDRRATIVRTGLLLVGAATPLAVLCGLFAWQGVLGSFWFWSFQYAKEYVSEVPLSLAWAPLVSALSTITAGTLAIWLLGACGLALLWLTRWPIEARVFLTGLLAFSFLAVCPGFYFREHYFILVLPAVALSVAVAVASIEHVCRRFLSQSAAQGAALAVFIAVVAAYVVPNWNYLFHMSTRELSRMVYGANPFVEAPNIARYLKEHTSAEDSIAILGSEPEIPFYADRRSATGHIYTYALMEPQPYASRLQDEMIQEVEAAHPTYVVLVTVGTSWLARPTSDRRILTWTEQYTSRCYDLAGITDIYSKEATAMLWDAAASGYQPRSENLLYTFRRKSDEPCSASPPKSQPQP